MSPYSLQFSLKVSALGCDRGGAPVLRGVSFEAAAGEAVQLFGENGAGKSSLLSVLGGHIKPVQGAITWSRKDGSRKDGEKQSGAPRSAMLFLGHEQGAKLALTAWENLAFWAKLYGRNMDTPTLLSRVGLENYGDVRAERLSVGQRRRLDLARLVIAGRSIWLLDEPAAGVDRNGAALLAGLVNEHTARGGMAIIATHEKIPVTSRELVLG